MGDSDYVPTPEEEAWGFLARAQRIANGTAEAPTCVHRLERRHGLWVCSVCLRVMADSVQCNNEKGVQ